MKTYQRWLGILLVALASAGLMVACGDTAQDDCLTSEDCETGDRCNLETETCGFACTEGGGECLENEECDLEAGDGGGVCVSTGGGEPQCTVNEDCLEDETCEDGTCVVVGDECTTSDECEGDQICVDGECGLPTNSYFFAQIADDTDPTADAQCINPDTNDPGSDIFGVSLTKQGVDGATYWARLMSDAGVKATDEDGDDNDFANAAGLVLDGMPPGLNAENCPAESFSDSVVALGCQGSLIVEFVEFDADNNATRIEIEAGDTISVYEYGGVCSSSPDDTWEVSICSAGVSEDDALGGTCNPVSGTAKTGTGVVDITVEIPAE